MRLATGSRFSFPGADGQLISYRTGPFAVQLVTDYPPLASLVRDFYPAADGEAEPRIHDFHISLARVHNLRRWVRPQIRFALDTGSPFEPYPLDHAFPLLEWGTNWCVAMRAHQYLMLHAAVVERHDRGLIMPAMPGSGKSTLGAALALSGWRLLSDEFGLVDLTNRQLVPLPRAVPLKNASIAVIRAFAPAAHFGPLFPKTRKGDVMHLRPPGLSLARQHESAAPAWLVFPRFIAGHEVVLEALPKSLAFTRLARNSFNYELLREQGFTALAELIDRCACFSLCYGDLGDAVTCLDRLCSA